jgi:hypothetical protein
MGFSLRMGFEKKTLPNFFPPPDSSAGNIQDIFSHYSKLIFALLLGP